MRRTTCPNLAARIAAMAAGLLISGMLAPQDSSFGAESLLPHQQLAREIYKELIEINTTNSVGDNTKAAEAMAARLRAAGFPEEEIHVLGPHPRKGNLVVRMRGSTGREPLLLLAHLDVVEARREDWSVDPFEFLERDGYFYGRGTSDDKAMCAIWIANLIRYKQEGFVPDRDLIVCLTADEEGGGYNGVRWLLRNHRNLIDAACCLNEGGGGRLKNGKRQANAVQLSEKAYFSFRLTVRNPGGHSSIPRKDNAIYRLARGLTRIAEFQFPVHLNEVTRAYFERMSEVETGQMAADMKAIARTPPDAAAAQRLAENPFYNALMRTTCVATRLEAGHADNALPQSAQAVVNCRIVPGESAAQVREALVKVLADEQIEVSPARETSVSPPSPLDPEVIGPIERITEEMWPGVPVVPTMTTGATDGLPMRRAGIPTYGVSGIFKDVDDIRAHGKDERLGVQSFFEGQEFLYRLVRALSSGGSSPNW